MILFLTDDEADALQDAIEAYAHSVSALDVQERPDLLLTV